MMQVIEMTHSEKVEMYQMVEKDKLIEMLIEANNFINRLTEAKNCVIPAVMGQLTCDSCGCHPNVIYTTSRGRFCEGCKPAS